MASFHRAALVLAFLTLTASCDDPAAPGGTGGTATTTTTTGGGGAAGGTTTTGGGGSGGQGGAGGQGGSGGTAGQGGAGGQGGSGGTAGQGGAGGAGGGAADFFGAISGSCGEINLDDIQSPDPSLFENTLDFTNRPMFDVSLLSPGGKVMFDAGNLGGSSLYSEIFAYEVLHRCDGAALLKTEADIVYTDPQGKKTDILLEIDGAKVGVSVVRAVSFPPGAPYPVSQAFSVLDGKLADILVSSANVAPEDAWDKQILAVVAQTPDHAAAVAEAFTMVDPATRADTIVLVTVTEGEDDFVYYNP